MSAQTFDPSLAMVFGKRGHEAEPSNHGEGLQDLGCFFFRPELSASSEM